MTGLVLRARKTRLQPSGHRWSTAARATDSNVGNSEAYTRSHRVLAVGIVIVFLSGLIRLWSTNRHMRKLELLDAEKQARVTQMRKSGLSPNGRYRLENEIPFGVKALESGVEVDGIWTAKMTSKASQSPNRKWSSRRKARMPARPLVETNELGSPNRRAMAGSRGSRRATKISRREIVEPSHETREKLENMSLLEESGEVTGDEQAKAADSDHKSPLGRIQRSLKKMASLEVWQDQERKRKLGRVEAREFREKAQAKKPRRFYPESSANTDIIPPLVAPRAKSHTAQTQLETLLSVHGASQSVGSSREVSNAQGQPTPTAEPSRRNQSGFQKDVDKALAARQNQAHKLKQPGSSDSSPSSADSFVTSAEVPEKPSTLVRVPGSHARRSDEDRRILREAPSIPARRSSRGSEHRLARQSGEARRSEERSNDAVHFVQAPAAPVARYPPNSSRSGPVVHRSQSSSRLSKQQQQSAPTPPSPTGGLGEVSARTPKKRSKKSVDSGDGHDGTLERTKDQQHKPIPMSGPSSTVASVRSSSDSHRSFSERKKLQKKRTRED